jgi:hypothetical protein
MPLADALKEDPFPLFRIMLWYCRPPIAEQPALINRLGD